MNPEFKVFAIKLICTLILMPLMGWVLMGFVEFFEKAWKTNNETKRWLSCCGLFIILAAISGWFV
jgi:hypothetical protein